ncbi:MAG: Fe-S cluster assembly ATPase SufC [Betaproteobacteria bacterium]|nr:Fe-S cluster assembly ATPase SufC [Betaproteobacteria bacterium]MBU6513212.1 Fe-S cluster assembly ATPase SufC [Betaproteobacteria bacterium]MDE1955038.1 Fe-S cluster assembly ATPase SufC [Betaproteobacteria bacterium]MDE2153356.1 Fe-S cluster assembly ATPase SufC [Betaproteobacteria bacterium]MDE2477830.1 Fe-S cluster assembly ATPase SufC [Betaproteobacteria bacterium]
MNPPVLRLRNLRASVGGRQVLRGVDLDVGAGEVHAVMGPNGAGKSTLAAALAGRPDVAVEADAALFDGEPLLERTPEQRACKGLFLGFQYPVELPGVHNLLLLRSALNAVRRDQGLAEVDAYDFLRSARALAKTLGLGEDLLQRDVNDGFSGGEKKRNEVLQLALLQPRLAILDEIDSGLDIDALKQVGAALQGLRDGRRSFVLVTHYRRLLDLVPVDRVHVMVDGRIAASGGIELAERLERQGYEWALQPEAVGE